jgi:uncharacterized protein (DUF934 family)
MPKLITKTGIADCADAPESMPHLADWLAHPETVAVRLTPDDDYLALLPHLAKLTLIAVNFDDFNDGRGFSVGRRIREAGYSGELRATGSFIRDQLQYLARCGFDAFAMAEDIAEESVQSSLNAFSVYYQAAQDDPLPRFNVVR